MMGTSHAVSGAAAWVAVASTTIPALGLYPVDPLTLLVGAVVCAGAALLPDADHHNATIAHSIPIAGKVAAGVVGGVSGGHRKGMHSLIAVALVIIGMFYLGQWQWQPDGWSHTLGMGAGVAVMATVAFATKVLKVAKSWPLAWILGAVLGAAAALASPEDTAWLPWCIGTGYLAHLLGDALTSGGVPFAWPIVIKPPKLWKKMPIISHIWLPNGALAVPVLGDTGSWREWLLSSLLGLYALWGLIIAGIDAIQTMF